MHYYKLLPCLLISLIILNNDFIWGKTHDGSLTCTITLVKHGRNVKTTCYDNDRTYGVTGNIAKHDLINLTGKTLLLHGQLEQSHGVTSINVKSYSFLKDNVYKIGIVKISGEQITLYEYASDRVTSWPYIDDKKLTLEPLMLVKNKIIYKFKNNDLVWYITNEKQGKLQIVKMGKIRAHAMPDQ